MKRVIVVGPPGSGTSAVAGMLDLLGVPMGPSNPADGSNPTGYFECERFKAIGRGAALGEAGWEARLDEYVEWRESQRKPAGSHEAGIWGLKSTYLPVCWRDVLWRLRPCLVVAVTRAQTAIRASRRRFGTEAGLPEALRTPRMVAGMNDLVAVGEPDLVLRYPNYIEPEGVTADALAALVGLEPGVRGVRQFLRKDLNHHG